jgi:hypothetical protein
MLTGGVAWWVSFHASENPMTRSPDPHLARQWQQRLERFEQSELTTAQFCQLEGYSTASFYQWRRKLRDSPPLKDPAFIPVNVDSRLIDPHAGRMNQIDLPGGAVIRFPSDATIDQQRHLITAVVQVTSAQVQS